MLILNFMFFFMGSTTVALHDSQVTIILIFRLYCGYWCIPSVHHLKTENLFNSRLLLKHISSTYMVASLFKTLSTVLNMTKKEKA